MRENMPGRGYAQGDGYVEMGPRKTHSADESWTKALGPDVRAAMRRNSFDNTYTIGRLPTNIRDHSYDESDTFLNANTNGNERARRTTRGENIEQPRGYNRPAREEPYVNALRDFFQDKIDLMPPKPRQDLQGVKDWLHSVMHDGRTTRDIAKELGVSQPAVVQARRRAVDQLVESVGGKAALAEKLRQYLFDLETQDGQDRLKYLPRWVHG